eukprot:3625593-Alexandrium_andersonii.AAC.1
MCIRDSSPTAPAWARPPAYPRRSGRGHGHAATSRPPAGQLVGWPEGDAAHEALILSLIHISEPTRLALI